MVCPRIIDAGDATGAKNEAILVAVVLAEDTVITEVFEVEVPEIDAGPLTVNESVSTFSVTTLSIATSVQSRIP